MNLPLPSFRITNFRTFDELEIPRLARVTLVVGRNNTGKTTLLEGAWVYGNRGAMGILRKILNSRDDSISRFGGDDGFNEPDTRFLANLSHGFSGDLPDFSHHSFGWTGTRDQTLGLWVLNRWTSEARQLREQFMGPSRLQGELVDKVRLFIIYGNDSPSSLAAQGRRAVNLYGSGAAISVGVPPEFPCRFIQAQGLASGALAALWDELVLAGREDQAVQVLRLLEPSVDKVSFVGGGGSGSARTPMVRLEGGSRPVPLRSMGDGMNRVLGIAAVAASTASGMALIDEFENGLHYSVLPAVWNFLFESAQTLNVQVLATTHSWDCVTAFAEAARSRPDQAALVRLERGDAGTTAKVVDPATLDVMAREGIEVR